MYKKNVVIVNFHIQKSQEDVIILLVQIHHVENIRVMYVINHLIQL